MFTKQTITRKSIDELSKVCPPVTVPSVAQSTIYGQGNGTEGNPFTYDEFMAFWESDPYFPAGSGVVYYINQSGNLEGTVLLSTVVVTETRPDVVPPTGVIPDPEEEDGSGNKPTPPTGGSGSIGGGGGGSTPTPDSKPDPKDDNDQDDKKEEPKLSEVKFKEGVNSENISAYATELLQLSIPDATLVITSTTRSPRQQAQAMVLNIERTGIDEQLDIYAAPGKSVLQVYDSNKSRDANISALTAKIIEVGPSSVSKHCADFTKVNVLDIRISSVPEDQRSIFWAYMQNHPNVSQILIENNVYHIVILLP